MSCTKEFVESLAAAVLKGTLHKLSFGKPAKTAEGLTGAQGRLVELKSGVHLALNLRTARTEKTINLTPDKISESIAPYLGTVFLQGDLYTSQGSWHLLFNRRGEPRLVKKNQVTTKAPPKAHDREKKKHLALDLRPWTQDLGLADSQGRPVAAMKDKIKQVEKFLEILEPELKDWNPATPLKILDLGAGKGYLSFALYQWLTLEKGWQAQIEAVEVQAHLCEAGNRSAKASGFDGLRFIQARIDQIPPGPRDMAIVLHACDTATDDALALGIRSGARWLFAAPCCHQELRSRMVRKGGLEAVLNQGILLERQAEILTDGLRALVLESRGYKVKVMEFVPAQHSGKNLMILGKRTGNSSAGALTVPLVNEEKIPEIRKIQGLYGLDYVYLESLLSLEDLGDLTPPWRKLGPVAKESLD